MSHRSKANMLEDGNNEVSMDEWLTVKVASEQTGAHVGHIYSLINRRKITVEVKAVRQG